MSAASDALFDLDAGRLCLDFANTVSPTSGEHLNTYADLLAFARQSQLLTPKEADQLQEQAERDPAAAQDALEHGFTLRCAIRGIFFSVTGGTAVAEDDLDLFNEHLGRALRHACITPPPGDDGLDDDGSGQDGSGQDRAAQDGSGPDGAGRVGAAASPYAWGWSGDDLERPLWPICRSAAELLTNASELTLVRQCGGPGCEWLFLDNSKNRSRQWCSMQSCGNRAKARRHYERVRASREVTSHHGEQGSSRQGQRQ